MLCDLRTVNEENCVCPSSEVEFVFRCWTRNFFLTNRWLWRVRTVNSGKRIISLPVTRSLIDRKTIEYQNETREKQRILPWVNGVESFPFDRFIGWIGRWSIVICSFRFLISREVGCKWERFDRFVRSLKRDFSTEPSDENPGSSRSDTVSFPRGSGVFSGSCSGGIRLGNSNVDGTIGLPWFDRVVL